MGRRTGHTALAAWRSAADYPATRPVLAVISARGYAALPEKKSNGTCQEGRWD